MSAVRSIIVVGRHLSIAEAVASRLGPEFKAAGIMLSLEDISSKTPSLFQSTPSQPVAIAFGGGFDDLAFSQARSIATKDSWPRMNWLRPDSSKQGKFSGGEGGKFDIEKDGERYGEEVGERIKGALLKLEGEGKLGEKSEEGETTLF